MSSKCAPSLYRHERPRSDAHGRGERQCPVTRPRCRPPTPRSNVSIDWSGTWTLKGHLVGSDEQNIVGEISFQWLEGGFFLQQDAEIDFAGMFKVNARELIGYDPEAEAFASYVYSNFSPTPSRTSGILDTLTISVSHGPLDASFRGEFSDDGERFSGGWRPNPRADETINIPYDVSGARVK